jgi:spore coat protein U-like protein
MKRSLVIFAFVVGALFATASQASSPTVATGQFDVSITLRSVCQISTVPTPAFSYTSFQATPATFSSSFNIRCTNLLPITGIQLDSTSVTDAATNLAYTLAIAQPPGKGTGSDQSVTISGSAPAGQAGSCGTDSCSNEGSANKRRTLTIIY